MTYLLFVLVYGILSAIRPDVQEISYPLLHTMPPTGEGAQSISMLIRNLQSLENDDAVLVGCTYFLNSTKKPVRVTVTAAGKPYHEVVVDTTGQRMLVKFEHLYVDKTLASHVG